MNLIYFAKTKALSLYTILAVFLAFSLTLTSCQQTDLDVETITEEETQVVLMESGIETDYEEVALVGMEALDLTDHSSYARAATDPYQFFIHTNSGCPTINHDSVNKIVEVDFGTSCVGADGKTRSGKVIITYTRRLYHPGAFVKIELENYVVDGKQIEGTKTIKNVSTNYRDDISLKTTLAGGKITWPDSTMATRQYTRTRTWIRAAHPINDEFHVEGGIMGTRRNGDNYSARIISTLIFKRKCKVQGIHIPVQGLKLIKRDGKPDLLVDFGDGQCDHLITLTMNGQSKVVDVRNR